MLDLAIIIPVFNEQTTINMVLSRLDAILKRDFIGVEYKIFVYDNNSTDNTCSLVNSFIETHKQLTVELRHTYKQGKGNVIRQAFREINAMAYCMIDGDDTYSVDKIKEMYDLIIDKKADMVIGDRLSTSYFRENKRPFHNLGNKLVKSVINIIFKVEYKDILSGLRFFSYQFVKTFPIISDGFTLETEMNIHAAQHGMRVGNIPIKYKDRIEGSESKLQTIPDGIRVIRMIITMVRLYKPLFFYGIQAFIFSAAGIGFIIPILIEFKNTGEVAKFPTLIVCCFVITVGILNFFMGLLQDGNNKRYRQRFEQSYIECETHLSEIKENAYANI